MKRYLQTLLCAVALLSVSVALGEEKGKGAVKATVQSVNQAEKKLQVKTKDGKIMDLDLSGDTKIRKADAKADFSAFAEGQNLKIKMSAEADSMKPAMVRIVEKSGKGKSKS